MYQGEKSEMRQFPDLSRFVNPRNIAVVGASGRESSQGRRLYDNLVLHSDLRGEVYPVNPAYQAIGDQQCWPSIRELPPEAEIDVAIIIVNLSLVLDTLNQCVERRIPFAIVMTSGFAEVGEEGRALEAEIADLCRRTGLHVYGPNCPGFVNVRDRLGMTFSPAYKDDLNSGGIGLATQGGGLGRNLLQGLSHGEGAAMLFSPGNEVDLDVPDFIAWMADDPQIKVIGVLMEGIKDGRKLAAALQRARSRNKPVVVLKVGRSEAGILAAQSHTASVAGSASVNSAVFRQFGAIEVGDLDELLYVARMLARPAPAPGSGVAIFTFSGGTAALAADIAGALDVPMAVLSPQTEAELRKVLPAFAHIPNPVDATADVFRDAAITGKCLKIIAQDPNVGTLLFPIAMDYVGITRAMAQAIVDVAEETGAHIVPVWMSRRLGEGFQILETKGLLPFLSLSSAMSALTRRFPVAAGAKPASAHATAVHGATDTPPSGALRTLNESAGKAMLRDAGFPTPPSQVASSPEQAISFAAAMGFPVVLKIVSPDIAHKTEAGGVKLNLRSEDDVRQAYTTILESVGRYKSDARIEGVLVEKMMPPGAREVLIGVHRDPAYGLILTFGLGGVLVEVLRDVTHRMIPLAPEDARAMIREIKHVEVLDGVRGQAPVDFAALEDLILKTSALAENHRDTLHEMEINPVWVGTAGQGALPLDALITFRA